MDNEKARHGKTCLHLAQGEAIAILTSDYCLAEAFKLIQTMKISAKKKNKITQILVNSLQEMCLGQTLDLLEEKSTNEQLCANRLKTASLVAAACEIGAILGHAGARQVRKAARYGLYFGVAYQLKDDYSDGDGLMKKLSREEVLRELQGIRKHLGVHGKREAAVFLREVTNIALSL